MTRNDKELQINEIDLFLKKKKKRNVSIRYQDKLRKGASLDRSNFKKACPVLPLVPGYSAAKGLSWMVMPGWKQFFLGRWMWACTGSISITWVFVRKAHSEMPHPRPAESETLPDPPAI